MAQAPVREVTKIDQVTGPKGGVILVHTLTCGCFVTRRKPAKTAPCIACFVRESAGSTASSLRDLLKTEMYELEAAGRSPAELAYRKGWNDRTLDLIRRFLS